MATILMGMGLHGRASFDVYEAFDLQPFGLRVVSLDGDLRVAVAKEAGYLMQRCAGVEQLRRDQAVPGVR